MQTIIRLSTLGINWLVYSSKDSAQFSRTIKGSILFLIASALATHFGIDVTEITDSFLALVVELGKVATAGYAVWGAFNKVRSTLGRTNAVLNDQQLQ